MRRCEAGSPTSGGGICQVPHYPPAYQNGLLTCCERAVPEHFLGDEIQSLFHVLAIGNPISSQGATPFLQKSNVRWLRFRADERTRFRDRTGIPALAERVAAPRPLETEFGKKRKGNRK